MLPSPRHRRHARLRRACSTLRQLVAQLNNNALGALFADAKHFGEHRVVAGGYRALERFVSAIRS
jgi:hypothetical protein